MIIYNGNQKYSLYVGEDKVRILGRNDNPMYTSEVQYLQGTTTTWMDTGIRDVYLDNQDWELFMATDVGLGPAVFNESIKGHGYYGSKALFVGYSYQQARHVKVYTTNTRYSTTGIVNVNIKCTNGYCTAKVNNTTIINNSARSSFTLPAFYLFAAANDNGEYNTNSVRTTLKLGKCWLSVGGETIFYLIPIRVGNVGYMYDKISKRLIGNSGTGNFTLGADVN